LRVDRAGAANTDAGQARSRAAEKAAPHQFLYLGKAVGEIALSLGRDYFALEDRPAIIDQAHGDFRAANINCANKFHFG
jgi:hypothetical protein